jgi:hypothetical protein
MATESVVEAPPPRDGEQLELQGLSGSSSLEVSAGQNRDDEANVG